MRLKLFALFVVLQCIWGGALADALIGPIDHSGNVSLMYQYNKPASAQTTSSRTLNIGNRFSSYIWQPWFITWNTSIGLAFAEYGGGSRESVNGNVSLGVLSRSRFPLTLSYSVTTSTSERDIDTSLPDGVADRQVVRSRLFNANQSFTSWGGTYYSGWYTRGVYDSPPIGVDSDRVVSENRSVGLNVAKRLIEHAFEFSWSQNESSSPTSQYKRESFGLNHNYSPEHEFGVSSSVTYKSSERSLSSESIDLAATSRFFWRPDYSDFAVNGSLSANESDVGGSVDRSVSAQLSGGYRITRLVRVSAGMSATVSEAQDGSRLGTSTQNIGLGYASDRLIIAKFSWGWSSSFNIANSLTRGRGESTNTQSTGMSLSHSASRSFSFSRRSSMSLSMSQSTSISKSFGDEGSGMNRSLSHSVSSNFRTSSRGVSSSLWANLADSRDLNEGSSHQGLQVSLTRDQIMGSTSRLGGSLTYGYNRSESSDGSVTTSESSSGVMTYNNSQFMGVHRLSFESELKLSQAGLAMAGDSLSSTWSNELSYRVGLLSAALTASFAKSGNIDGINQRYMFSVTRSF